jgi:hypothetical protein
MSGQIIHLFDLASTWGRRVLLHGDQRGRGRAKTCEVVVKATSKGGFRETFAQISVNFRYAPAGLWLWCRRKEECFGLALEVGGLPTSNIPSLAHHEKNAPN